MAMPIWQDGWVESALPLTARVRIVLYVKSRAPRKIQIHLIWR